MNANAGAPCWIGRFPRVSGLVLARLYHMSSNLFHFPNFAPAGVTLVRWSSRGPLHRGGIQRVQSNVRWLGVVSAGLALFFAGCCGDLRETRLGTGTMIKQAGKNSGEIMRTTTMGSAYGVSDDIVQRDLQEIIKG
eukprot:346318-Amorphochlora_amoeboformis.AAC.1